MVIDMVVLKVKVVEDDLYVEWGGCSSSDDSYVVFFQRVCWDEGVGFLRWQCNESKIHYEKRKFV